MLGIRIRTLLPADTRRDETRRGRKCPTCYGEQYSTCPPRRVQRNCTPERHLAELLRVRTRGTQEFELEIPKDVKGNPEHGKKTWKQAVHYSTGKLINGSMEITKKKHRNRQQSTKITEKGPRNEREQTAVHYQRANVRMDRMSKKYIFLLSHPLTSFQNTSKLPFVQSITREHDAHMDTYGMHTTENSRDVPANVSKKTDPTMDSVVFG